MNSAFVLNHPNSMLLETNLRKEDEYRNFLFTNPVEILEAFTFSEAERVFKRIEFYIERDFYLAGYISYEAGYLFEESFRKLQDGQIFSFPLIWFGVYKEPLIQVSQKQGMQFHPPQKPYSLQNLFLDLDEDAYRIKILKILEHIKKGETYQVNFTFRLNFDLEGDVASFYESLKSEQKVSYSAFIHDGKRQILSLSPELFFKRKGNEILARPMKGTGPRGKSRLADLDIIETLKTDAKSKAENSMIVDLIRNDLGKISEIGSVQLEKLLEVEEYETLFQMTSTVRSILKKETSYFDLFKAIFPGGSVTGAPKYKTMQIIQELESSPRGIYTGAIGFISKEEAIFNIPIRTIEIEKNKGLMGIGSGIVWDSTPEKEYKECLLKQKFLQNVIQFQLIESILFKNGNYIRLKLHLKRLEKSAFFFDFCFEEAKILESLDLLKKEIVKKDYFSRFKVRLLLFKDGSFKLEYSNILRYQDNLGRIQVSPIRIRSTNIFQHHKTTHRKLYDSEYKKALQNDLVDYIFLNEKEEVVEASIYNLFIQEKGFYYTPPLSSGGLAGIMREYLLQKGKLKEKTLTIQDLMAADKIYLCNSVRGIMRVSLEFSTSKS